LVKGAEMGNIASAALALGMIAALILIIGGVRMAGRERKRGLLMIAAGVVIFGNVLIWTV
jgi:hypothetical protein